MFVLVAERPTHGTLAWNEINSPEPIKSLPFVLDNPITVSPDLPKVT